MSTALENPSPVEEKMDVVIEDSRGTKRKAEEITAAAQAPKRIKVENACSFHTAGPVDSVRPSIKTW